MKDQSVRKTDTTTPAKMSTTANEANLTKGVFSPKPTAISSPKLKMVIDLPSIIAAIIAPSNQGQLAAT
ncbi:hypothetical protein AWI87_14700 [Listeria monocytogenes]|nr:hypothetical protein AWI87_14700 [Listeria monocytogenes]